MFSNRLPADLSGSTLSRVLRAEGDRIDLTVSNPTACGFDYPAEPILSAVADRAVLTYDPHPLGALRARRAVLADRAQGAPRVPPEHLLLTASTSEAYAILLKLLCSPGDAVAVGAPSYPLLEHLAELEGVRVVRYRLDYGSYRPSTGAGDQRRWQLDLDTVRDALEAGARALVVINPNNPTGSGLTPEDAISLQALSAEHQVPIIADEVFAPYLAPGAPVVSMGRFGDGNPLTFVLGGLSKGAGLPQIKAGWVAVRGEPARVDATMERLEWIADAYLSVSAPTQVALPRLLAVAPDIQAQIRDRVARNRRCLCDALGPGRAVELLASDGGWYAVLRVPQVMDEEQLVTALATRWGVVVHPGFFYDFQQAGHLVAALLQPPEVFGEGTRRLLAGLGQLLG